MLPQHLLLVQHPSSSLWQPVGSSWQVSSMYNTVKLSFSAPRCITFGLAGFFLGAMVLSMHCAAAPA
jgi:hypothetical protein